MARGLDAGKYFWRSVREKCFSLDIPFNRTSDPEQLEVACHPTGTSAYDAPESL
jgi:hypothetical protein